MLSRQVVLDARGRIVAYEFAGSNEEAVLHAASHDGRMVFLRCDWPLASNLLGMIDPEKVVLRLNAGVDAARDLALLREQGFRFALDQRALAPAARALANCASFIWIDAGNAEAFTLLQIARAAATRAPGAKLVASGIRTADQFKAASAAGFALFEGDWFARAVAVPGAALKPVQAVTMQLMQLVRTDAEPAQIEEVLKRDPGLSLNLLRLVNSSGLGLRCEITSFRHAVMILGLKKLFRWASLLLVTSSSGAPAVAQTAVVRGRLMELLATEMLSADECDNAFVVGIFSLLEAMTGLPAKRALEGISLPDTVTEALIERAGPLAPFLDLAIACETADDDAFAKAVSSLQLSDRKVNMAHLQALAWAEDLMSASAA